MLGAGTKCRRGEVVRMPEKFVGKSSEFKDGDRRIVFVDDKEIGVFRDGGQFYAYSTSASIRAGLPARG